MPSRLESLSWLHPCGDCTLVAERQVPHYIRFPAVGGTSQHVAAWRLCCQNEAFFRTLLSGHYCRSGVRVLPSKPFGRTVTSAVVSQVLDFVDGQSQQHEADLAELLRIPSVSADSQFAGDVRRAAQWLVDHLKGMGLAPELIDTAGHPIVYAETPAVPGAPVALVYGHYDVQPPDPLDKWTTPPFEPTVRNGAIFARGATDDKGQMLTHVHSVAAWLKSQKELPLQVKFLIEGEEEVGSEHLDEFF